MYKFYHPISLHSFYYLSEHCLVLCFLYNTIHNGHIKLKKLYTILLFANFGKWRKAKNIAKSNNKQSVIKCKNKTDFISICGKYGKYSFHVYFKWGTVCYSHNKFAGSKYVCRFSSPYPIQWLLSISILLFFFAYLCEKQLPKLVW